MNLWEFYTSLDKKFIGLLPGGGAAEEIGNKAVLNGKPVIYDGTDWVSPESFKELQDTGEIKKRKTDRFQRLQDLDKDRNRPIGSEAVRDGKPVLWAGIDLGYQSPETFEKLKKEGYKGNQNYMLAGGVQGHRIRVLGNEVLEAASPHLQNIQEKIAPALPHLQTAYETVVPWHTRKSLEIGGSALLQGLDLAEQGMTATSRALGVDPIWGNLAIETAAELATPWMSTTAAKYGAKALKAADKLRDASNLLPLVNVGTDALDLTNAAKVTATVKLGKTRYAAKVNAFDRYKEMVADGYDMSKDKTIQRLINKVDNADNLPKHIKQYTDEVAYKKAVDEHIANNKPTNRIREEVGVFVDEDGSVRQWESRGKLQFRSAAEGINTDLNRELDRFLQSPQIVSYNRIANVRHFMKEIGFPGTEREFKAMYELHHVNAIKVYAPFFKNLKPKQAAELRKLAEDAGIYLGNDPRNLVPLLKRKHTLDKDSIHTFMRENGIEGSSKWPFLSTEGNKLGSYDPQARMAALLEGKSVQERFEVLKGFQEWVQKPANEHLSKLIDTNVQR